MFSTLLILAVCRTGVANQPSKNGPAHHESLVAQWLEPPTGIWEAMGSIPVGKWDFFFVTRL